jgi:hypothetical protein
MTCSELSSIIHTLLLLLYKKKEAYFVNMSMPHLHCPLFELTLMYLCNML